MASAEDLTSKLYNSGSDSDDESGIYPWDHLVSLVKDAYDWKYEKLVEIFQSDGESEETASAKAYNKLIPVDQKHLRFVYLGHLRWMEQMSRNDIHNKI